MLLQHGISVVLRKWNKLVTNLIYVTWLFGGGGKKKNFMQNLLKKAGKFHLNFQYLNDTVIRFEKLLIHFILNILSIKSNTFSKHSVQ